jgi:lipopolysaccharide export LptBFGC system permease protein LptF
MRAGVAVARGAFRPALVTLVAIGGLWGGLAGVRVLEAGAAAPGPVAWLAIVAFGALSSGSMGVPAAVAAGVVASVSAFVDDGSWVGMRASGVSGRRLVPVVAAMGLCAGGVTFAMSGYVEPIARRSAGRAVAAAVDVRLFPGSVVSLGGIALRADAVDDGGASGVFIATGSAVGAARHAVIDRTSDGVRVELVDGEIAGLDPRPWNVRFDRWRHDVPSLARGRVELDQRTNPELSDAIGKTEAAGRDARYERAVLWKRWLHPIAAALWPISVLPLGVANRPLATFGAVAVGYLVAVRAGDQLANAMGAQSALAGPLWVLVCGIVAWARWRDR